MIGSAALLGWSAVSAAGGALVVTPRATPGPFYPDRLPLDDDNDLVSIAGRGVEAEGHVSHVFGRVLDAAGRPLPGAKVEIWQCDANGRYIHTRDAARGGGDPNFQGYGRTVSDGAGTYRFRTIKPVPYPGRTPHIHFAVTTNDGRELVTQMYVAGEPGNARDFLYKAIHDPEQRAAVTIDLQPRDDIEAGALGGVFDIVLPD